MKYIVIIIILLSILIINSACEQTVSNVSLPYKEQLVIRAVLEEGETNQKLTIERTLPPLDFYDYDKALVKDAEVIVSDGENNYVFSYVNGFYINNEFNVESGKTYNLTVNWKNKTVKGQTTIPYKPEFENIEYEINETIEYGSKYYYVMFYVYIQANEKSVYRGIKLYSGSYSYYEDYVYRYIDRQSDGKLKLYFRNLSYYNQKPDANRIMRDFKLMNPNITINSFDEPYYKYFNSRYNGDSSDDIFGTSGQNIEWNIKGDGIGMFIGMARTERKI